MEGSHDDIVLPDALLAEVVVADDLLVIDASGVRGEDGGDGRSYAGSRAARGQRGRDGEDGTRAQSGEDAGEIEITLRPTTADEKCVELLGRRAGSRGQERMIREVVTIGEMGFIRLVACGGRGGNGGRGGDGQMGGQGHDGSDATRFSSGSDGGPGGDGGDGGDGTSGGDGGRGGRIVVQVDQQDTHLLMLTRYQVAGGERGSPGANGVGGDGGPGGDGGRSHNWTTTSTEHYTDAQGQRQTRTVTHHHRNRGGSDGYAGRRGRDGQGELHAGVSGAAGELRILVRDGQQTIPYLQRYEVAITGYDIELTDSFAEPTSLVQVSQLRVRNSGGMPTPSRYPVVVLLAPSRWLQPHAHVLTLPHSLEPGESYTFADERLLANVPEIDFVPEGDPLRRTDRVSPLARQTGSNRFFDNLHPRQEFSIALPGELEAVQSLESQTPGRAAMFVIGLTNRSQHDLGRDSASQRFLGIRVELVDQDLAPVVMLLDTAGNRVDWDAGYREEIGCLRAGESWSHELIFGILPGAPGYRQASLKVSLLLGQLDEPSQPKERHCRTYPVRIAQAYDYDPSADILLVANHGTTLEELGAWKAAAARLDQTVGVWDISLNDSLSLSEKLAHGQSLLRDFHGRTIVLGNAPFRTSLGTRYGDQFLSQMDLIRAAESHGIRLLVVNDEQHELAHLFQERLVPIDGAPEYRYDSVAALEKAQPLDDVEVLFDQVDELIEHGAQAARPNPISQTSQIDIYGIRSPNARRLRKLAARLQCRLQNNAPGRRVVVMYQLPTELSPEQQERIKEQPPRGGLFFSHVYQGSLLVMPTLGDDHPNLVVLNAPLEQIHEPDFVGGAAVSAALMQSLGFEEKLYLLSAKMRDLGEQWRIAPDSVEPSEVTTAQFLVDAILVDLATEQAAILKTPWKGLFSGDVVRDALRQLTLLAEHPFTLITGDVDQPDVQLAARLVAGLALLGRSSSRWYESRLFPWGFFRRGPVLRHAILAHQQALTRNLFRQPNEAQSQLIDEMVDQYFEQARTVKRQTRKDKRTAARKVLFAPLSRHGIVTDAGRAFPAVLSFREWDAIQRAELDREASRLTLRENKADNRATYGVAVDGRALDGIPPQIHRALAPFTEACAAARSELLNRAPSRTRAATAALPPIGTAPLQEPVAGQQTQRVPPAREEA